MEEIYEKCKSEILFNEENKIKSDNKKIEFKNIIKSLFNYSFGIIYQYDSKEEKLKESFNLLKEIIEKNCDYSIV